MNKDNKGKYDDIINMPHHVSSTRPHMSAIDRAAQFSPFAALTGYEGAIMETARLTDERIQLDEDSKAMLNEKLQLAAESLGGNQELSVTYFQPDEKKERGSYITVTGSIKKIDEYERTVVFANGTVVPVDEIVDIEIVQSFSS